MNEHSEPPERQRNPIAARHPPAGSAPRGGGRASSVHLSSDSSDSDVSPVRRRAPHARAPSGGGGGACGVKLVRDALGSYGAGLMS